MAIETRINEGREEEITDSKEEENAETNGEVDTKEEFKCALSEIKKLRKRNLKQRRNYINTKKRIVIQK